MPKDIKIELNSSGINDYLSNDRNIHQIVENETLKIYSEFLSDENLRDEDWVMGNSTEDGRIEGQITVYGNYDEIVKRLDR